MGDQLSVLVDRIRELIQGDTEEPSWPPLAEMEHTLADGYARALALEGERWRLQQRIGELAHEVSSIEEADELRSVAAQVKSAELDLDELRGMLEALRSRVESARDRSRAERRD